MTVNEFHSQITLGTLHIGELIAECASSSVFPSHILDTPEVIDAFVQCVHEFAKIHDSYNIKSYGKFAQTIWNIRGGVAREEYIMRAIINAATYKRKFLR